MEWKLLQSRTDESVLVAIREREDGQVDVRWLKQEVIAMRPEDVDTHYSPVSDG